MGAGFVDSVSVLLGVFLTGCFGTGSGSGVVFLVGGGFLTGSGSLGTSSGGAGNGSTLRVGDLAIRDLGWNISR